MDKILVFIPAYNCERQIGRVLAQFRQPVARFVHEVLVLDNGSRDGTVAAAVAGAEGIDVPRTTVARNDHNYGLGGSHKSAFAYAAANGFTHVITLHGDDQGDVSDIEPVLADGLHHRSDACMGSRFMHGSRRDGYSTFRIFGNHVFNAIYSIAGGRRVQDLGSGLNLVGRAVFTDERIHRHSDDLTFNTLLLLNMFDRRRRVVFFPISWREDDQVSNVKMVSQAKRTLDVALHYLLRRRDFRTADHRQVQRDRYTFTPAATFEHGVRTGL